MKQFFNSTQIPNYLIYIICQGELSLIEIKVVMAICRQTIGWHKETDWITFGRFKQLTDLSDSLLSRSIDKLVRKGVIVKEGEKGKYIFSLNHESKFIAKYEKYLEGKDKRITLVHGEREFEVLPNAMISGLASYRRVALQNFMASLQSNKCFYCENQFQKVIYYELGKEVEEISWVLDHYIPLSKGGDDVIENVVLACISCNRSKRDMMPEEYFLQIKRDKKSSIINLGNLTKSKVVLDLKSSPDLTKSKVTKENNTKETTQDIAASAAEDKEFNFSGYLQSMFENPRKHVQALAIYADELHSANRLEPWSSKGEAEAFITRNVRPGKMLAAYSPYKIRKTTQYMLNVQIKGRPMEFSIETVLDWINKKEIYV